MAATLELEETTTGRVATTDWWPVALIPAIALLVIARCVAGGALDQVWAEDGAVFMTVPINDGFLASLTHTHNGYLHLAAMLLGNIAAALPLVFAPYFFTTATGLVLGALALFVYNAADEMIESRWLRAVLGLSLGLMPASAHTIGSISMLHFYLVFAAVWALVGRVDTPTMRRSAAVIVFLAATSSGVAFVLIPFAVWRFRDRRHIVMALGSGLVIQAVAVLLSERGQPAPDRSLSYLGRSYVSTVGGGATVQSYAPWSIPLVVFAFLGITAALVAAASRRRQLDALVFFGLASMFCAVAFYSTGWSLRYGVLAGLCVVAILLIVVQDQPRVAGVLMVSLLAVLWAVAFPASDYRTFGPSWPVAMSGARCEGGLARVAVTPWTPFDLPLIVPCDRL